MNNLLKIANSIKTRFSRAIGLLSLLALAACAPAAELPLPQVTLPSADLSTPSPVPATSTWTPVPPTLTPQPSLTPTPMVELCSPLEGFEMGELENIISNPFNPPRPGEDYPHHGIDLSFYRYGDRLVMLGLPIHAVLQGTVAMSDEEREPYGNTLLIETPLDSLPPEWLAQIVVPQPVPTIDFVTPLTCPTPAAPTAWNTEERSLYLLYAHMNAPSDLKPGDPVGCGQQIGEVGNSGNSINEHLHLEVRVGPAGARFPSMAHYTAAATPEEMYNYCTWRISGLFQMIDPTRLLFLQK